MTTLQIETPRVFLPLLEYSRYKGVHGGRGSGKSHFFAELVIEQCMLEKTDVVCVREIQKSLNQSVKKLLEGKIESMGVGHMFEVQEAVIKAPHGGRIIFTGMHINMTRHWLLNLETWRSINCGYQENFIILYMQ